MISFCNPSSEKSVSNLLLIDLKKEKFFEIETNLGGNGFTGLNSDDEFIYALYQSEKPILVILKKDTWKVFLKEELKELKDPHSLEVVGDKIYAVSTGADQVLEYQFDKEKRTVRFTKIFWSPKESPQNSDTQHLNSIFYEKKSGDFFVSAFGEKSGKKNSSAKNGYIFNISKNQKLVEPIYHPHSIFVEKGDIYYCESVSKSVKKNSKTIIELTSGYTRGLFLYKNYLFLGTSSGRKKSKSTNLINNPGDPGGLIEDCRLLIFKKSRIINKYKLIKTFNFLPDRKEIYDIKVMNSKNFREPFKHYKPGFEYEKYFQDTGWPWSGHKFFAYDFVRNFKPKTIVELGTHKGTSLWSFAQAAKDGAVNTEIFAVDTWQGEEHAGFYGEEIFEGVKKIKEKFYPRVKISLLRKTFDEAAKNFKGGSIDLLHIDGLHTYEAVKHDFETWLPKVKKDGAIMFHDIFVSEKDFGVYKLWKELKKEYASLEFHHSFGLGIIFLDKTKFENLVKKEGELQRKYSFLSEETKRIKIEKNKELIKHNRANLLRMNELIEDQKDEIVEKNEQVTEKNIQLNKLSAEIDLIKNSKFWKLRNKYLKIKNFDKKEIDFIKKESWRVLSKKGIKRFFWCIPKYILNGREFFLRKSESETNYDLLVSKEKTFRKKDLIKKINKLKFRPKLSLVLKTKAANEIFLRKTVFSIINQPYQNWELFIIIDKNEERTAIKKIVEVFAKKDSRIIVQKEEEKNGFFSYFNKLSKKLSGDYLSIICANDELSPYSFYEILKSINKDNNPDIVYTDEDLIDENSRRLKPKFKPDWSPELLISNQYLGNLKFISKKIFDKINGYNHTLESAEEYDLMLRISDISNRISHIPKVLYHKRFLPQNHCLSSIKKELSLRSGRLALKATLERRKIRGRASIAGFDQLKLRENYYRIKFESKNFKEKVTIIIPTKDNVSLLKKCIKSIRSRTDYPNYEILVINNNSQEKETFDYFQKSGIRYLDIPTKEFNFSKINNLAVKEVDSELVLFLNNDIEVLRGHWLTEMVGTLMLDNKIGAVGAKLLYADHKVQHGGVILGMSYLTASHANKFLPASEGGYQNYNLIMRNYSAVTAACMLTRKSLFDKVEGFDEKNLAVAFNDVDYCLKLRNLGYRIVWNPEALLFHHESASRGTGKDNPDEPNYFRRKWLKTIEKDPYYNPNLSLENEQFEIKKK